MMPSRPSGSRRPSVRATRASGLDNHETRANEWIAKGTPIDDVRKLILDELATRSEQTSVSTPHAEVGDGAREVPPRRRSLAAHEERNDRHGAGCGEAAAQSAVRAALDRRG